MMLEAFIFPLQQLILPLFVVFFESQAAKQQRFRGSIDKASDYGALSTGFKIWAKVTFILRQVHPQKAVWGVLNSVFGVRDHGEHFIDCDSAISAFLFNDRDLLNWWRWPWRSTPVSWRLWKGVSTHSTHLGHDAQIRGPSWVRPICAPRLWCHTACVCHPRWKSWHFERKYLE